MSLKQNSNSKTFPLLGKATSFIFIVVIMLTMGIAGLIALSEGTGRFMQSLTGELSTEQANKAVEIVRADPTPDNMLTISSELWGLSKLSDVSRYAESRLMEHGVYYTIMPKSNQVLMVVHVLFGSFCMLLGGLQFWPWFRKKHLKAHRIIGAIYIVTVPISVVASLLYMANTAPHHIYDHLVAWIALWAFGLLSLLAITMAVLAIRARKIYEHQAWMALSFACLMVAPLLRWDWALLAALFPHIDQETLNLVTMGIMLPEVILIGYGLILINRQYVRAMKQRPVQPLALLASQTYIRILPILYMVALIGFSISAAYYLLGNGLSDLDFAKHLVPEALALKELEVLNSFSVAKILFVLASGAALLLGLYLLKKLITLAKETTLSNSDRRLGLITAALAIIAGAASFIIGWNIGLAPHNALFSGGTMYVVNGSLLLFFGAFYAIAQQLKHLAYMKESLVFLLCLLPFSAMYALTLTALSFLPLPADYITQGQGYVIPAGFSGALLFIAIIHVMYSQATREHN